MSVLFVAMGCARSARPDSPGSGPVGKGTVYSGPADETVSVVPLLPLEDRKFLIQYNIPGDDHDGKVLLHTASEDGTEYWARWRGRNIRFFLERKHAGRRTGEFLATRMLEDGVVYLKVDTERTRALDAEEVQELYLRQLADGTLAKGEAFDKKFWAKDHERQVTEAAQAMNAACGSSVAVAISWEHVPEKMLDDGEAIGSYCSGPIEALKYLCEESAEARRTVQAQVKRVDCRAGDSFSGRVEADTVVWSIAPGTSGPNSEQYQQFFMDNL
ncbi:hypothetical protein HPC49_11325 [Pyxidicoccus fallax]|uniref:Uncharacterized protein n=1 Tax=Pyxidicoccus fallax TaxID=394095 RepID=A0A848LF20_9BACT|nr:hypothetical protein [Pyxidicoccus fallax]NMO17106.1 hypothetical protein [Pyxidicoccus fallax]NPC78829.1 hypothetical protein [Pyxidicoccus fallax]